MQDPRPRRRRGRLILALLLGAAAGSAQAGIVTITFAGSLAQDPFGISHVGAPVTGRYRFDAGAVDDIADPGQGSYTSVGPEVGFSVDVDGTAYAATGSLNIGTQAGRPGLYLVTGIAGTLTLELVLGDATGRAVADDALPLAAPDLAAFDVHEFRLFAPDAEFTATLDRLQGDPAAVPEPGTWALLLAGLSAAGVWRRRRRSDG